MKTYFHNFLLLPHHNTFYPTSRQFYQLSISSNDRTALFSGLQIYKPTSRTTLSFAVNGQVNYRVFHKRDACSMSSGTLFHIIRNILPYHLEQYSTLAITRRFILKRNERSVKFSSERYKNRKHEMRNRKLKIYALKTQI